VGNLCCVSVNLHDSLLKENKQIFLSWRAAFSRVYRAIDLSLVCFF
jgi:hypothetical protein